MWNKAKYIFWGKAILIALLLVFVVRTFWVESYLIFSSRMDGALVQGDRVFVNKTAYGLRLPITILSVPFTFDSLFGLQSYSSAVQLPYTRLGETKIPLHDVVLYNNPLQTSKPLDKRTLCIGRCLARPGDTIKMNNYTLLVKNDKYEIAPEILFNYSFTPKWKDALVLAMTKAKIPSNRIVQLNGNAQIFLSNNELDSLYSYIPDTIIKDNKLICPLLFPVPKKGKTIKLLRENIPVYMSTIVLEQGKSVSLRSGELLLHGKKISKYTFRSNYYWMSADTKKHSVNFPNLDFVPEENIVGKVSFVWFSFPHWERIFSQVK